MQVMVHSRLSLRAYSVAVEVSRAHAGLQDLGVQQVNDPLWKQVWKIRVPNKLKVFLWKALHDGLAVGENLARRIPHCNPQCPSCQGAGETAMRLFSGCSMSRQVWLLLPLALRSEATPGVNFLEWWKNLCRIIANISHVDDPVAFACVICWRLWKARNSSIFNDICFSDYN